MYKAQLQFEQTVELPRYFFAVTVIFVGECCNSNVFLTWTSEYTLATVNLKYWKLGIFARIKYSRDLQ